MHEFTATTGASIIINAAPWIAAKRLKMAIEREVSAGKMVLDFNEDAAALAEIVLKADSSGAVDEALWPCLNRCTRNGEKIQDSTFDDAEARRDYYEIVIACLKENFGPLAGSLFSWYGALLAPASKQADATQKSA